MKEPLKPWKELCRGSKSAIRVWFYGKNEAMTITWHRFLRDRQNGMAWKWSVRTAVNSAEGWTKDPFTATVAVEAATGLFIAFDMIDLASIAKTGVQKIDTPKPKVRKRSKIHRKPAR